MPILPITIPHQISDLQTVAEFLLNLRVSLSQLLLTIVNPSLIFEGRGPPKELCQGDYCATFALQLLAFVGICCAAWLIKVRYLYLLSIVLSIVSLRYFWMTLRQAWPEVSRDVAPQAGLNIK